MKSHTQTVGQKKTATARTTRFPPRIFVIFYFYDVNSKLFPNHANRRADEMAKIFSIFADAPLVCSSRPLAHSRTHSISVKIKTNFSTLPHTGTQ